MLDGYPNPLFSYNHIEKMNPGLGEVSWKGITAIAICAGQRPPVQLHARVKRNLGDAGADGLP